MTGRYLLAIDAGTGSCRALLFTETGEQAGGRRSGSGPTTSRPACPAARTSTSTRAGGRSPPASGTRCAAAGATGDDVAAVAATSMREGMVLYDAAGHEIWACPNVDSRAAAEAEDLIREGAAEKIYAEAGDWVSITAPARLRWLARHRPGHPRRDRQPGHAQRLDRLPADRPARDRTLLRVELGHVQRWPRRRWSPSHPGAVRPAGRPRCPPVADPGTVVGEVTAAAAEQTGLRPGTPVAAGGADTQLGLLGAGAQRDEFTVVAGTFWQNTVLLDRAADRPGDPAADAVPRDAGRVDARGHRLLLRDEHALVPGRVLRRRGRAGPRAAAWTRTW